MLSAFTNKSAKKSPAKKIITIREKLEYIKAFDDTLTDEKLLALSTDKLEEMYKCIQEANVINTKAQSYVSLCKMGLLK